MLISFFLLPIEIEKWRSVAQFWLKTVWSILNWLGIERSFAAPLKLIFGSSSCPDFSRDRTRLAPLDGLC